MQFLMCAVSFFQLKDCMLLSPALLRPEMCKRFMCMFLMCQLSWVSDLIEHKVKEVVPDNKK